MLSRIEGSSLLRKQKPLLGTWLSHPTCPLVRGWTPLPSWRRTNNRFLPPHCPGKGPGKSAEVSGISGFPIVVLKAHSCSFALKVRCSDNFPASQWASFPSAGSKQNWVKQHLACRSDGNSLPALADHWKAGSIWKWAGCSLGCENLEPWFYYPRQYLQVKGLS